MRFEAMLAAPSLEFLATGEGLYPTPFRYASIIFTFLNFIADDAPKKEAKRMKTKGTGRHTKSLS